MTTRIIIVGAGGHAQVVADILLRRQQSGDKIALAGYVDDNPKLASQRFLDRPVLGTVAQLDQFDYDALIIAIGDNEIRKQLFQQLRGQGKRFITAIHPQAVIAPDVVVGKGAMICAGVVVNTGATIGANTILNTACSVDHHNHIGDHCHIAPGAHLGGEVTVGNEALIGIGATIMPRCHIGTAAIVAAGATVTGDVSAHQTVAGTPARPLQE